MCFGISDLNLQEKGYVIYHNNAWLEFGAINVNWKNPDCLCHIHITKMIRKRFFYRPPCPRYRPLSGALNKELKKSPRLGGDL